MRHQLRSLPQHRQRRDRQKLARARVEPWARKHAAVGCLEDEVAELGVEAAQHLSDGLVVVIVDSREQVAAALSSFGLGHRARIGLVRRRRPGSAEFLERADDAWEAEEEGRLEQGLLQVAALHAGASGVTDGRVQVRPVGRADRCRDPGEVAQGFVTTGVLHGGDHRRRLTLTPWRLRRPGRGSRGTPRR
jgi:hypothetical protein